MGRPKGSKNKQGLKKGYSDGLRGHLTKVIERDLVHKAEELSSKSGIGLREVCNDAMAEGLACLETDAYKDLIIFRSRRGKVIRERELVEAGEQSQGSAPAEGREEQAGLLDQVHENPPQSPDPTGLNNAVERPGQPTENREDSLVSDAGEIAESLISGEKDIPF